MHYDPVVEPMKITKGELAERLERFEQVCRGAGIKLTHQRVEIFREVAQTGDHPDAETVCRGVRERIPTVSLDTVYRALWLLGDLGLISKLGSPWQCTRFDANLSRHHHFICTECGLTRDFYSDEFDELRLPDSVRALGQVKTTHVEARGMCLECASKERAKTRASRRKETRSSARS
jgi:Fur family peroxide stress response transcriptional regulator